MQEYLAGARPTYEVEYRLRHRDGSYRWILSRGAALWDDQGRPFRMAGSHTDVTARRRADQELEKLNAQLLEASRRAGMAEVATGVLHNVGNVLNSVNVSATLVKDFVAQSRIPGLAKLSALLESHREDLATFLTSDDKGRQAIDYLTQLSRQLVFEQSEMLRELDALTRHVGHIKEIVAMQQSYADVAGVVECVSIPELLEDALRINTAALARHQVDVVRDFQSVPDIHVDKHKILQVLVNLISNAKHALAARPPGARRMTLRVGPNDNGRIHIQVQDNGVGIPPENLTRIFSHGFTTRKGGHGFGLHSGALAAKEMGGRLTAHSDGLDRGATFTLELPLPIRRETPNPPRVEAMLSSASRSTSPPVPLPS
jgi:C4-dicarboxylate-specific signal transduction histidine kinase